MTLRCLWRADDGALRGVVELPSREGVDVSFTTQTAEGITVATPNPNVFGIAGTAVEVRRIVAAVVAFEQASNC